MLEAEFGSFERAFKRASAATQQRWKQKEAEDVVRTYFRLLEGWPLELVLQAFKTCCQTLKHFPKVPEVIALLEATRTRAAPAQRQMTATELLEHDRARLLHYEDDPCHCLGCVAAGVADRPLRFVPTLVDADGDIEARAYNPLRSRVEVVGHWAHGAELRRWYDARDRCFARWRHAAARAPQLVLVGAALGFDREPGEEG